MVSTQLTIKKDNPTTIDNAVEIDGFIDDIIAKHSDNSETMNLMALEATALATAVESRSKNLEEQNWLSRSWNELTGKNHKISARNSRDLAQSQYLGQQMLVKLAEGDLITYQMVVALGDKVSRVVDDVNDTKAEVAQLNHNLANFFPKVRDRIESLEQQASSFKRNDDLLFWKDTMMFDPIYNGKTYPELNRTEKIICLANEFYHHSHQEWSSRDLAFLKSVLVQVGHQPTEKVKLREVYEAYQNDEGLLSQLTKGMNYDSDILEPHATTPTLYVFSKLQSHRNEEKHIIETILSFASGADEKQVSLELTSNDLSENTGRNLDTSLPIFDAVMNFVEDLTFYKVIQSGRENLLPENFSTQIYTDRKLQQVGILTSSSKEVVEQKPANSFRNAVPSIKILHFHDVEKLMRNAESGLDEAIILPKGSEFYILGITNIGSYVDAALLNDDHTIQVINSSTNLGCEYGMFDSKPRSDFIRALREFFTDKPFYMNGLSVSIENMEDFSVERAYQDARIIILDIFDNINFTSIEGVDVINLEPFTGGFSGLQMEITHT